ncbi:N-6 DNA methylase [Mycobacterium sp. B14F4]|uniref:HsdM family class I SAM-dependent methyltransferase n=1 Tax=Mycobacterium sp. B14F4 TaxID=3153565 RepID=UPI00325E572F
MARPIVDERTLAGYLIGPTELRARELSVQGGQPLIRFADIEEHVVDPQTGVTLRCDLTLRSDLSALISCEMKRPEVMGVDDPKLIADAQSKAVGRGLTYFLTCNIRHVAVWRTSVGARQTTPVAIYDLAPDLSESYYAQPRREEIGQRWRDFLGHLEPLLLEDLERGRPDARPLPPHVEELREAIVEAGKEAGLRIREAATDDTFRDTVLDAFRDQFGVELQLDPFGPADRFINESEQVGIIAAFVVTSRLLLYQALSLTERQDGSRFDLDPLEVSRSASDPGRIAGEVKGLLDHAQRQTGDFETTLTSTALDDIAFVSVGSRTDVGMRWGRIIDVVKKYDWSGPSEYVPGLYESLLDDEHRHILGVHYTPDPLAEIIATYSIRNAADTIMDPACGGGTFLTMAYARKRALGSTHEQSLSEVYGVEIADFAASLSSLVLALSDPSARSAYPRVIQEDFFGVTPGSATDLTFPGTGELKAPGNLNAVIGNPPYIRFENRTPEERAEIQQLFAARFVRREVAYPNFTGKADLWAFFVAHSHSFLAPGGRLAFVLSWSLLSTVYGDAVLSFLGRYFLVDALIDSRVERWFAAAQNTVLLLARRAEPPPTPLGAAPNPNIPDDHMVRFVRFKQPIIKLLDYGQPRGKRAEDLVDEILGISEDTGDDIRWDVRVADQANLIRRSSDSLPEDDESD